MKLVLEYLRRHLKIFLVSTIFLTMEAFADLLQPTFMSLIVDEGIQNVEIRTILKYGLIMLAIALVGACSAVMRNHFASRTSQTVGKELRHDMYAKIQSLSQENIDTLSPASLITRITNDVNQIQEFINSLMRMMIKAPITCIGAIVLIIVQTPKQAPIMLAIIVIASVLIYCNIRIGYPRFGIVQKALDKINGVTREFLSAVRVVKAFRAEDEEVTKFDGASEELAKANTSALQVMAIFAPLINLSVNFGIVILLWISNGQDQAHIGRLMASVNYMTQVLFAVTMISNIINTAVRAMASSERIQEVFDEVPAQEEPSSEDPEARPEITGQISFEDVSFRYKHAGNEALTHVSFDVHPGETIGIIGPTGSGKSTLVNLIPRMYDASAGRITLDGHDVTKIVGNHLRNAIAVVPQKALLFTGSIKENLRWGRKDATEEEIVNAAKMACADDFIRDTENGYETMLGQGGVNLSGGQKQRLSLARALIRKPKILILDDCTSALDAQTEASVLSGLRGIGNGVTVLLISQRISAVMRADRILCMDNAMVRGIGTHDELMQNCQTYKEIYDSQIGGEK